MRRRRWRTAVLWVGCTLCVLIVAAFVLSARWQLASQGPRPSRPALILMAGSVALVDDNMAIIPVSGDTHSHGLSHWNSWAAFRGESKPWSGVAARTVTFLEVPLYAVFAAVAVPTLLVWRFWPKPVKPGHCECGYDLHGNQSGVCPECGRKASRCD